MFCSTLHFLTPTETLELIGFTHPTATLVCLLVILDQRESLKFEESSRFKIALEEEEVGAASPKNRCDQEPNLGVKQSDLLGVAIHKRNFHVFHSRIENQ